MVSVCASLDAERYILVGQELEEHHERDGHQLGKQLIDTQHVDQDVQDEVAEQHAAQTHGEEDGEPALGVVFHLEVERAVQGEARDDPRQDADAIGQQVMNSEDTNQKGVDAKVQAGGAAAYYPVEDKVAETAEKFGNQMLKD